jgi:hypothetical protein
MRVIVAIGLALLLSLSGFAQTATVVYQGSNSVLDTSGNLFVFDSGRNTTGVTITGLRHSFFAPKTRITVQRPGSSGNIQTVEYDGDIRVIGVGTSAVYAIATAYSVSGTTLTTTQSLIAIRSTLPAGSALTGFASLSLASPVEARVGPSDYISLITLPDRSSASAPTARTARVVHFNGSSFDVTSSATLP